MQIQKLCLFTCDINAQKEFYVKVLGFDIFEEGENLVSFEIGSSILEFRHKESSKQYHFAFNIPDNKVEQALEWLKARVEILKDGDREIQDFEFWNARAIYFYDADRNIVEFISRKNLKIQLSEPFGMKQVLEICEIGIPTVNIEKIYKSIYNVTGTPIYSGGMDRFCSQGNEHGLFIIIDKTIKRWFPSNDEANSADFELIFEEAGVRYHIVFSNEEVRFLI